MSEQDITSLRPDPGPGRELEGPWHTHYPPGQQPSAAAFEQALSDVVHALDGKGLPYLMMGGVSTAVMARPRQTDDIDLFVTPDAAAQVTAELRSEGADTGPVLPYLSGRRAPGPRPLLTSCRLPAADQASGGMIRGHKHWARRPTGSAW